MLKNDKYQKSFNSLVRAIERGDVKKDDEITPNEELFSAIKSNDSEEEKLAKIKRLFEKEPKLDIDFDQGKDTDIPLHIAVRKGKREVVKLLIEEGAKVNDDSVKNERGRTPLDVTKRF